MDDELKLNYQAICDNPRVAKIKNKALIEIFDIINSFEYNCLEANKKCWDGCFEELKESIELVEKANEGRRRFNLSQLQKQRNKLNRQISTLKKQTPN